jgi:hypothetical protein
VGECLNIFLAFRLMTLRNQAKIKSCISYAKRYYGIPIGSYLWEQRSSQSSGKNMSPVESCFLKLFPLKARAPNKLRCRRTVRFMLALCNRRNHLVEWFVRQLFDPDSYECDDGTSFAAAQSERSKERL